MINLFRRIRQKLFAENNFGKYLLYVIGEILLVVIGILIALQIDNINEQNKLQSRQAELLEDLKSDLNETLTGLNGGIHIDSVALASYRILLQAIENNEPYSVKIDSACTYLIYFHVPRFTNTTYESIKSQGLDLITNDVLKKQIARLYERQFNYLKEDLTETQWSGWNTTTRAYITRYLKFKDSSTEIMVYPVDFERMKEDREFINFLSELIVTRSIVIGEYRQTIAEIEKVIKATEEELAEFNEE
jgi:hypothetical protein